MPTHPVFLCVEGRRCLVAGGDAAAARRARALHTAGATVTVVAPRLGPEMASLLAGGGIEHLARDVRPGDLTGVFLAYATGLSETEAAALAAEATVARALLNVTDQPRFCSFHEPAVVDRGGFKIAVGTSGASPGLAAAVRGELDARFGPEYRSFVGILTAVRRWRRGGAAVEALRCSTLLDLVRAGRIDDIDRLLTAVVGEGCTLAALGVQMEEGARWS